MQQCENLEPAAAAGTGHAGAEAAAKDTPKFVSLFAEGGYFYDVEVGKRYYGKDIGYTVDVYTSAFPDMHCELYSMYFNEDVVVVELSLNGRHKGNLAIPEARGRRNHSRFPVALEKFLTISRSVCFHDTGLSHLFIPLTS
jgi:hypothetical protein